MDQKAITKVKVQPSVPAAVTPITLLEQALAKDVDLEKLTKLMDLQERWEKKEARRAFLDALADFQTKVPVIPKKSTAKINSQKGNYTYTFANLGTIAATIKEALKMCGLSYRWDFKESEGKMLVTCYVSHRDGHTETSQMYAAMDASGGKNEIQQKGSTQTYLQRYTLIGALGLATADEDNDAGNAKPGPTVDTTKDLTEEEMLDQWRQLVAGAKTRTHLRTMYLQNQKAVDDNVKVQDIFKTRQDALPDSKLTKANMP